MDSTRCTIWSKKESKKIKRQAMVTKEPRDRRKIKRGQEIDL